MKIAISSNGKDLNAQVESRFGRCQYFLIVDTDAMNFKSVLNEGATSSGGAGIKAAQFVAKMGVKSVITGKVGPNASRTLQEAGIKIITGISGTVKDVLEKYKEDKL